eukprot:5716465-Prymnesium_polylepis.1
MAGPARHRTHPFLIWQDLPELSFAPAQFGDLGGGYPLLYTPANGTIQSLLMDGSRLQQAYGYSAEAVAVPTGGPASLYSRDALFPRDSGLGHVRDEIADLRGEVREPY